MTLQGDVELSDAQADRLETELLEQLGRGPAAAAADPDDLSVDPSAQPSSTSSPARTHRRKRKVGRENVYQRWDKRRPISFEFADSIPAPTRERIREALALWQRGTCLRFLENGPDLDRLEFYDGGGCSSFVGRTGGTQVSIGGEPHAESSFPILSCSSSGIPEQINFSPCT